MSRASGRLGWAVLLMVAAALWSGCSDESKGQCETATDCGDGFSCVANECVLRLTECSDDADCEGFEQCNGDGECVVRTSCASNEQCPGGQVCNGGSCAAAQCESDADCRFGQECNAGTCRDLPRQCSQIGQSCDPNRPTNDGFSCDDVGQGSRCYTRCNAGEQTNQNTGAAETVYTCAQGSMCVNERSCKPSECSGFLTGADTCAQVAAQSPEAYPNGAQCSRMTDTWGNYANVCQPAGTGRERASCSSDRSCAPGYVCINQFPLTGPLRTSSFCAKACQGDEMCGEDTACIGDDSGAVQGVGFCGDRCEPWDRDTPQCAEGIGCMAVSNQDGLCYLPGAGTVKKPYDACNAQAQQSGCPSGTLCLQLSGSESRCVPTCDPTLEDEADRDATCPGPNPKAYGAFAHLVPGAGEVKVLVNGQELVDSLGFGQTADGNGRLFELNVGENAIAIVDPVGNATLFEANVDLGVNDARTWVVVPGHGEGASALEVVALSDARELTRTLSGEALLRVAHHVDGAPGVDILATLAGQAVADGFVVLAEDLELGEMGEFVNVSAVADANTSAVPMDLHLFAAGAERVADNALKTLANVDVTPGKGHTLFLLGNVVVTQEEVPPTEEGGEPTTVDVVTVNAEVQAVDYISAPRSRQLGAYCFDLNANRGLPPQVGLGICLEKCTNSDQYGQGMCSGDALNACSPVGNNMGWCFPSGLKQPGESCTETGDCADGAFCENDGTGSGVCRAYCQTGDATNEALGCTAEETCIGASGYTNFGRCRVGCEPGANNSDASCPENLQSCYSPDGVEAPYCRPSGDRTLAQTCGSPDVQNCAAGLLCAQSAPGFYGSLVEPFQESDTEGLVATCREMCTPFKGEGNSGCGEGFACSPVLPGPVWSTTLGHCAETIEPVQSLKPCPADAIGKMCGENAFCVEGSGDEGLCLQLCDFATREGCSEGTVCDRYSDDTPALLDVYGICR